MHVNSFAVYREDRTWIEFRSHHHVQKLCNKHNSRLAKSLLRCNQRQPEPLFVCYSREQQPA